MKNYIYFIIIMISFVSFSQQTKTLKTSKLWLKNDTIRTDMPLNNHSYLIKKQFEKNNLSGILGKIHTIFVVYSSDIDVKSQEIVQLKSNKSVYGIHTDLADEINNKDKEQTEVINNIMSVRMSKRKLHKGDLQINKHFMSNNRLYEIIYFPQWLNNKTKRQIETYLSVKYGISLQPEISYYDTGNNKIWDAKANKEYSFRVFGVGLDSGTGLRQYTSTNASNDLLQISYTKKENIEDKSYFLIGDNNKKVQFYDKKDTNISSIMNRKWKISSTTTYPLDFLLQINEQDEGEYTYWMMLSNKDFDIKQSQFIKGEKLEKGKYFFGSVNFGKYSYFTFVQTQNKLYPGTQITFYPNPVVKGDVLHIHVDIPKKQKVVINIFNDAGQLIISDSKTIENNQELTYKLPQTGIYFIKLSIGEFSQTTKIICE